MAVTDVNIACIGHMTVDDVVLHTGITHFGQLGGNALYSSLGAWLWERENVGVITRKGKNISQDVIDEFARHGFDTRGITVDPVHNSPQSWQIFDRFSNRYTVTNPESGSRAVVTPDRSSISEDFLTAKGFHVAPLQPLELVADIINYLPKEAVITCDPSAFWCSEENLFKLSEVFPRMTAFMPSESELVDLFGIKMFDNPKDYLPYLEKLAELGAKLVVLKVGEKGAVIFDAIKGECYRIPAAKVKLVSALGAGDAFCGSFVNAFVHTHDPLESAIRGTISSSFVVEVNLMTDCFKVTLDDVKARYDEYCSTLIKEIY